MLIKNILLTCCVLVSSVTVLLAADNTEAMAGHTPQRPVGKLSFSYSEQKAEYRDIEGCIRNTIDTNLPLQSLLNSSLKKGDLKVVLDEPHRIGLGGACYMPSERSILISSHPNSLFGGIGALDADLGQQLNDKYKIKSFMFELGNSVNTATHAVHTWDYSDGDAYAMAMEMAEANTHEIIREAVSHEYAKGGLCNSTIFVQSSQEKEKKMHAQKDSHYQFYIKQYHDKFFYNKFWYYSRKPAVYVPVLSALSLMAYSLSQR